MRLILSIIVPLILISSLPGWAAAQEDTKEEDKDYPVCFISGERWDTSSTRVGVIFILDGEPVRGNFLNLSYMLMAIELFDSQGRDIKTHEIYMLDYDTFGTDHEEMIKVNDTGSNIWLWFTDEPLEGSAAPYLAAFKTKEAAEAHHKKAETGSQVLSWNKALDKLVAALLAEDK